MSTFTVDPATLEALHDTLCGLFSGLSDMNTQVTGYQGRLGGGDLEGEVGHFMSRWHEGIGLLKGDMTKVVEHLGAASAAYARTEALCTSAAEGR